MLPGLRYVKENQWDERLDFRKETAVISLYSQPLNWFPYTVTYGGRYHYLKLRQLFYLMYISLIQNPPPLWTWWNKCLRLVVSVKVHALKTRNVWWILTQGRRHACAVPDLHMAKAIWDGQFVNRVLSIHTKPLLEMVRVECVHRLCLQRRLGILTRPAVFAPTMSSLLVMSIWIVLASIHQIRVKCVSKCIIKIQG